MCKLLFKFPAKYVTFWREIQIHETIVTCKCLNKHTCTTHLIIVDDRTTFVAFNGFCLKKKMQNIQNVLLPKNTVVSGIYVIEFGC